MVLQRRPDFKVIISSATLNPKVFQRFFSAIEANIPVLRLQHHAFPVQVHYAPPPSRAPEVLLERVVQLTRKVVAPGKTGHLLIFLPGEGWIHTLTDALRAEGLDRYCWILPLYARLKTEDQHRVFAPAPQGKQKVILATNLAETSITIPGIQYVLDTGLAKIPSYDADTGITSLRECFVSQAAAKQRMGRAGRTEAGEVWRLYHADELKAQPSYHPEEILRSDLSEIVLHLVDLGIQKPTTFPLPTPPPKSKIYAAIDKLRYLGAIDRHTRLTDIGREMVRFPLSPTIARMLVAGIHQAPHALHSVLQMSSLLSARSPLLYPPGEEDEARHQQKRFRSPWGDTMMLLNAYQAFLASAHRLEFCKKFYLDYEILTFTQHVYDQLARICTQHGIAIESGHVEPETLVFCLATGFSEKILRHERGPIYRNSQGIAIALHPGSCLFRTPPAWAVATEWVAHKRPMAMQVSRIKEEWLDHGLEAETSASTTSTKATSTKAASAKAASTKAASAKAASSRRHLA
jgi:HrpA-like RNA helicase